MSLLKPLCRAMILCAALGCTRPSLSTEVTTIIEGPTGALLDSVLTPYVEELRRLTDNTAGLAIGVTHGDRIVYARAFGYANLASREEADLNTRFHIASLSKPFTAAAVARLVGDGVVNLDDPVTAYIPEFQMQGDGYATITVRQLLTHTSGIPRDLRADTWLHPVYGPDALEQNLMWAREHMLESTPGTEFSYSNAGFDILGLLVSRAGRQPFSEYVRTRILEPAGMTGAQYDKPADSLPPEWAAPYSYGIETQEWAPYPYTGSGTPSSGLQATILDMSQWGLLHLANGRHAGTEVLRESEFREMVSPQFTTPWGDAIGLGWYLQSYLGHPNIMHLGNDTGFEAAIYIYPDDDISIVVLANRDFARTGRMALAAAEILFGAEPKGYTVSAKFPFAESLRTGGVETAITTWERLRQDTTDQYDVDDDDLLTTGAVLENGGRWSASRDVLEYYLSLHDASAYAWRLLGNARLGLGDTTLAITAYENALRVNPSYDRARVALTGLQARTGK
jgi:CubicO group peptidase (beta-lactamase class C family)